MVLGQRVAVDPRQHSAPPTAAPPAAQTVAPPGNG
jgi:hypothetical protein